MESVVCVYCENRNHEDQPFCGRCGGRPRGETAAEQAHSRLLLVERLIHQRIWLGVANEIASVQRLLEGVDEVYRTCEPALNWLVEGIGRRRELEPNLPRVTQVARLVFELVRGDGYADIRDKLARLEQFISALQQTDTNWSSGRPPSQRKASAWFAQQAELAGITAEDALESLFETPEYWPVVSATVHPESHQAVAWKVEVAQAEADLEAKNYGKSRDRLVALLAQREDCASAHECLGQVLKVLGQTGQAIDHFRAAVRTGDASPTGWNNLAWYLVIQDTISLAEVDEALWAARRAVSLAPRAAFWDTLAAVLSRKGDLPNAIAAAREAIRLKPDRQMYLERMHPLCAALPRFEPPLGPAPMSEGELITLEQAAARLGLTPENLKVRATLREVRGFTDGETWLFRAADIDAVLKAGSTQGSEGDVPDSDSEVKTIQLKAASNFELEESTTRSKVFALDNDEFDRYLADDDVDQNA